jgi:hypothetical protein
MDLAAMLNLCSCLIEPRGMGMSKDGKYFNVLGYDGDPCHRCGKLTQIREHIEIKQRHLKQPFYYSRWFCCVNPNCRTTLIMPERFKVFRDQVDQDQQKRLELINDQLDIPW